MSSLGEERVSVCMQDRAFVGHRFTLKGFSPTGSEGPKVDCGLRLGTTRELRTRRRRSQAWYAMVPKSEPVAEPTLCPDRWPERAEERRLRGGSARWQPGYPRNPNWVPLFDPTVSVSGLPLVTPGFPDQPSGHGCVSGAILRAMRDFFETDEVPFTAVSNKCLRPRVPRGASKVSRKRSMRSWTRGCGAESLRTADVAGAHLGKRVAPTWTSTTSSDGL